MSAPEYTSTGWGSTEPAASGRVADAALRTRRWLERVVVAERLCPFAARALHRGDVRIVAEAFADVEACLVRLAAEAETLAGADESPDGDAPTLLLVLAPRSDGTTPADDFDDFLDLSAVAEALLEASGHESVLQLASFHPAYAFEGEAADDPAHATNRAPHPTLHLLRESAVTVATERHPDPGGIPARNVERLRALGAGGVRRLLARIDDGEER